MANPASVRRRRGGRRHRRNRDDRPDNAEPRPPLEAGQSADASAANVGDDSAELEDEHELVDSVEGESDESGEHELEGENEPDLAEGDDEDRIVAVTPFPPIAEDEFDDAREDLNDSLEAGEQTETTESGRPATLRDQAIEAGISAEAGPTADDLAEKPARGRGGRSTGGRGRNATEPRPRSGRPATLRGRQIEAGITSEPEAAIDSALDTTEPIVEADAPDESKSKRRRGGRSVSGRAASARRAPRKPPTADQPSAPSADVAPVPPVERTGSTDRHLVDDVPVDPEPPRRPRSYDDLDAVPDDFD